MTETQDKTNNTETSATSAGEGKERKTLSLSGAGGGGTKKSGTLSLRSSSGSAAPVRGRGPGASGAGAANVAVEVRRSKRGAAPVPQDSRPNFQPQKPGDRDPSSSSAASGSAGAGADDLHHLTSEERDARIKALQAAIEAEERRKIEEAEAAKHREKTEVQPAEESGAAQEEKVLTPDELRRRELEELKKIEEEERQAIAEAQLQLSEQEKAREHSRHGAGSGAHAREDGEDEESYRDRMKRNAGKAPPARKTGDTRRRGKLTVTQVLNDDFDRDRGPSLAAQRRAREKARLSASAPKEPPQKVKREVIIPETITVQELSNRMAERGADLIKSLMKMGVMATINQSIDADTAELLVDEFGHIARRVTEADVEEGLEGADDPAESLKPRPPVVTIMGHVDHGKTSLLDVLRQTDIVSGEAGGITQHIGAYQVTRPNGAKITFLDTPGHAAFTEMRSRGANVTDIVVLVVAADDSLMPQTIEAINHARAAKVPLIVAVNKIDLPAANPVKVKQDLLQHEVIVEDMGGDTLCIEVSAKQKLGLDKLEEAILLQAEMLELNANPDRLAQGTIIESKIERGRGSVGTVLIERGTLSVGDAFVAGIEWGRVRAIIDDKGRQLKTAIPGQPVEVLGLNGTPEAGDKLIVLEDESKAREISEYRQRKRRTAQTTKLGGAASFEALLAAAKEGEKKTLPILIKADVHGSAEALSGSLQKITEENEEIDVRIVHMGVGGINESDITLAKASGALVVGFNVRANTQARELAHRESVDIRYYNVIYNVIDDAKAILGGMLSPKIREEHIGYAEIRQVFSVSKVGKVAGCMVTAGTVKRGAGVRLLRDDVVIHEGKLKTLKRFKDEVKDVREGMECGMGFENYDDIKDGDVIECFEIVEEARTIE